MKRYKVKDIIEPDFGCEGVPEGEEPCCEVELEGTDGEALTVRIADAELYRKEIFVGCSVEFDGRKMKKLSAGDEKQAEDI